jgi:hypothetical protein
MFQHKSQIMNSRPLESPMASEQIQDLRHPTERYVNAINAQRQGSVPLMGFHSGVSIAHLECEGSRNKHN